MGRKTGLSALPMGRRNIVISRSKRDDVEVMSLEEVGKLAKTDLFIIGGGEIYFDIYQRIKYHIQDGNRFKDRRWNTLH